MKKEDLHNYQLKAVEHITSRENSALLRLFIVQYQIKDIV